MGTYPANPYGMEPLIMCEPRISEVSRQLGCLCVKGCYVNDFVTILLGFKVISNYIYGSQLFNF